MNKVFSIVDRLNSIGFNCNSIAQFSYGNFNYLIYYFPHDDNRCQVFLSRVVTSDDGSTFITNDLQASREELSRIAQGIIIELPSSYSNNVIVNNLFSDFCLKYNITFLKDFPSLGEQKIFKDSFLAFSDLSYIQFVESFYNNFLPYINYEKPKISAYWSIPSVAVVESTPPREETQISGLGNIENIIPVSNIPIASENEKEKEEVINTPSLDNNSNNNIIFPFNFELTGDTSVNNSSFINVAPEKVEVSSDVETRILNEKNAGFASSSYIVIGTICLILAIVVVGISIVIMKGL